MTNTPEPSAVRQVVKRVTKCSDAHFEKLKQANDPIYLAASYGYAAALSASPAPSQSGLVDWPDGVTRAALSFDDGILTVKPDGSAQLTLNIDLMEDSNGPYGGKDWRTASLPASEVQAIAGHIAKWTRTGTNDQTAPDGLVEIEVDPQPANDGEGIFADTDWLVRLDGRAIAIVNGEAIANRILSALTARDNTALWQPIETCPMWELAIVMGEDEAHTAITQKCENDWGDVFWAVEPDEGLQWEPKYWMPYRRPRIDQALVGDA